YEGGTGGVMSMSDRVFHGLLDQLPGGASVTGSGCAWSRDGRVAFTYHAPASFQEGLAIFDAQGRLIRDIALNEPATIAGWLPDGSGIVMWYAFAEEPAQSWVMMTDGTVKALPFAADEVLGFVP
ncbi:MAG: hypothetical protein ACREMU_11740, partial [Gemmatimonadaceae bacterium]